MARLSAIVAVSENSVIGKNNSLPWHLPEDLRFFRKMTSGHPVIMGRNTFVSLGKKALNDRPTYVVTSQPDTLPKRDDVIYVGSLQEALDDIDLREDISHTPFVIGGAALYAEAFVHPAFDKLYMTRVNVVVEQKEGDSIVSFPGLSEDFKWMVVSSEPKYSNTTNLDYELITWARRQRIKN